MRDDRGVRDRGDGVRDAGPGGHDRDRRLAGQLGVGVGHVDRGALVADVDDPDPAPRELVPDRLDVTALQAEHPVDPVLGQELRHQAATDPGSLLRSVPDRAGASACALIFPSGSGGQRQR